MVPLTVSTVELLPDDSRLIARPFLPGGANYAGGAHRLDSIARRIGGLNPEHRARLLADARRRAKGTFFDIEDIWRRHATMAAARSTLVGGVEDEELFLLLGACFTQSYAYEAAALTNPSLVPWGPMTGERQSFVMSARAIGEGHISSIAFLTGSVGRDGTVELDPRHPHVSDGDRHDDELERESFTDLLDDMGFLDGAARQLVAMLGPRFTPLDLELVSDQFMDCDFEPAVLETTWKRVHWVASSNYQLNFDPAHPISEHLVFPGAPAESQGIEDARFVRMLDDQGERFVATYTAYDGSRILPQLIETKDFHSFRMSTLTGPAVHHKGMALFPRRVDGEYLALSRHDHERLFLTRSDDLRCWSNAEVLFEPDLGWEAVQTGNCGSPLETDAGWLVLTHGVGPMRRYVIGALLLDLDNPHKVIGRLSRPLLEPREKESVGYVPDVVYSCGGMIHDDILVIPFGFADYGIRIAVTLVDELLEEMVG